MVIDAADAWPHRPGRAPCLKRLAKMLSAQAGRALAAVRAMSQIGGDDARPAVDFLIEALRKATEVEGYNMMIYLSLLGPVAKDAIPAIRSTRIKNPVLPSATIWAIEADKRLPWPGRPGMRGPRLRRTRRAGRRRPRLRAVDLRELRPRVGRPAPSHRPAAGRRRSSTARPATCRRGATRILACGPGDTLSILTPHLAAADIVPRPAGDRGAGLHGPGRTPAAAHVQAVLAKASTERERRLYPVALAGDQPRDNLICRCV